MKHLMNEKLIGFSATTFFLVCALVTALRLTYYPEHTEARVRCGWLIAFFALMALLSGTMLVDALAPYFRGY